MSFSAVTPIINDILNVVIETPRHSETKFAWDPKLSVFKVKKTLPLGMMFPFDFGFLPNTIGGDGDPLDVLVIMEQASFPGCLVECRMLGVLEAKQKEKKKKAVRNDRIIAVSIHSTLFGNIDSVKALNSDLVKQVESFFANYNLLEGKTFTPIAWRGIAKAMQLIKASVQS